MLRGSVSGMRRDHEAGLERQEGLEEHIDYEKRQKR